MQKSPEYIFHELFFRYSTDEKLFSKYWSELDSHYHSKNRFYHNWKHIEAMLGEIAPLENQLKDFEAIQWAIFYHDSIYQITSKRNEEKSAELAQKRLEQLNLPSPQIQKIYTLILATKSHQVAEDTDVNYLLDTDLSILGKPWDTYEKYAQQIRKEYAIYPDFLYQKGRKKVLESFLTMNSIFKTSHFQEKYENQARNNLKKEMEILS